MCKPSQSRLGCQTATIYNERYSLIQLAKQGKYGKKSRLSPTHNLNSPKSFPSHSFGIKHYRPIPALCLTLITLQDIWVSEAW